MQGESKKCEQRDLAYNKQVFLVISFLTNMYEISKKKNFDKQSDRPFKKSAKLFFTQNYISRKTKVREYIISITP